MFSHHRRLEDLQQVNRRSKATFDTKSRNTKDNQVVWQTKPDVHNIIQGSNVRSAKKYISDLQRMISPSLWRTHDMIPCHRKASLSQDDNIQVYADIGVKNPDHNLSDDVQILEKCMAQDIDLLKYLGSRRKRIQAQLQMDNQFIGHQKNDKNVEPIKHRDIQTKTHGPHIWSPDWPKPKVTNGSKAKLQNSAISAQKCKRPVETMSRSVQFSGLARAGGKIPYIATVILPGPVRNVMPAGRSLDTNELVSSNDISDPPPQNVMQSKAQSAIQSRQLDWGQLDVRHSNAIMLKQLIGDDLQRNSEISDQGKIGAASSIISHYWDVKDYQRAQNNLQQQSHGLPPQPSNRKQPLENKNHQFNGIPMHRKAKPGIRQNPTAKTCQNRPQTTKSLQMAGLEKEAHQEPPRKSQPGQKKRTGENQQRKQNQVTVSTKMRLEQLAYLFLQQGLQADPLQRQTIDHIEDNRVEQPGCNGDPIPYVISDSKFEKVLETIVQPIA